ncbi:hypothetical protein TWF694_003701 [Orbilia ellipsospora]|uniref:Uncharacterized protein n=1 Tax=Orbilia ellipsospora TaxID=2528407 RepID=A0AAV9WZB8_9PEZI
MGSLSTETSTPASNAKDGQRTEFISTLSPYKHSIPLAQRYSEALTNKYYGVTYFEFSTLEPRLHHLNDVEERIAQEFDEEWYRYGGSRNRGTSMTRGGGGSCLLFPEADPNRLFRQFHLMASGGIEDAKFRL